MQGFIRKAHDTELRGPCFISQLHNLEMINTNSFSTFFNHGPTKNITLISPAHLSWMCSYETRYFKPTELLSFNSIKFLSTYSSTCGNTKTITLLELYYQQRKKKNRLKWKACAAIHWIAWGCLRAALPRCTQCEQVHGRGAEGPGGEPVLPVRQGLLRLLQPGAQNYWPHSSLWGNTKSARPPA